MRIKTRPIEIELEDGDIEALNKSVDILNLLAANIDVNEYKLGCTGGDYMHAGGVIERLVDRVRQNPNKKIELLKEVVINEKKQ